MELLGHYGSPFVRRVGVTLHLYGIGFTHRPLGTIADAATLRPLNPLGRIPVLMTNDGPLFDSLFIIDWLDEQAGTRALIPRDGAARRAINQWVALAHGAAEKYVAAYYERERRPRTHVWQPWLDRLEGQVAAALAALDAGVRGPWLMGAAPTHADVTLACAVLAMRGDMAHLAPPGRHPALDGVVARAADWPAFRATEPANP